MGNVCTVNRVFYIDDGVRLEVGAMIDADSIPLGPQLIRQRFLVPAPENLSHCMVTRPFLHGDQALKFGDVVDAGQWPNADKMIEQRFIEVCSSDEKGTALDLAPVAVESIGVAPVKVQPVPVEGKRGRGRPRKILGG
jgi:hypothetical protein